MCRQLSEVDDGEGDKDSVDSWSEVFAAEGIADGSNQVTGEKVVS